MYSRLPVARKAYACKAVIMYMSSIQKRVYWLKPSGVGADHCRSAMVLPISR
jgi:hypothetical protein